MFENQEKILEQVNLYFETTGISLSVADEAGEIIPNLSLPTAKCFICKKHTSEKCCHERQKAGRLSFDLGEAYIFTCPSTFTMWTSPIISNGAYVGAYISEPIIMDDIESYVSDLEEIHLLTKNETSMLRHSLENMKNIPAKRVNALAKLQYVLAKELIADEAMTLAQRKRSKEEQSILNEELQRIKGKYQSSDIYKKTRELETTLSNQLKSKNIKEVRKTVNELLSLILLLSAGNLEVLKVKWFELILLVSHSVTTTLNNEEIFGLNLTYLKKVMSIESPEEVYQWMTNILNKFINYLENGERAVSFVISGAKDYMKNHCYENLTLSDVAENIYLSPSYLSRVFKKEVGENFVDYLNKLKIEKSLDYVRDLKYEIADISAIAGFSDQSYYTKVFKKIMGVSPKQFRKGL